MPFFKKQLTRAEREKLASEPYTFTDKVFYTSLVIGGIIYVIFLLVLFAAVTTANA